MSSRLKGDLYQKWTPVPCNPYPVAEWLLGGVEFLAYPGATPGCCSGDRPRLCDLTESNQNKTYERGQGTLLRWDTDIPLWHLTL